jgi:hypothetical protein
MKSRISASLFITILAVFLALPGCGSHENPLSTDARLQNWVDTKVAELDLSDVVVLAEHDWRATPTEESGQAYFAGSVLAASVRLHDILQTEEGTVALLSTMQGNRMYFRFLLNDQSQEVLQRSDWAPVYIDTLPGSGSGSAVSPPPAVVETYRLLLRVDAVSKEVVSLRLCSDQQAGYDPEIGLARSYVFEGVCLALMPVDDREP